MSNDFFKGTDVIEGRLEDHTHSERMAKLKEKYGSDQKAWAKAADEEQKKHDEKLRKEGHTRPQSSEDYSGGMGMV